MEDGANDQEEKVKKLRDEIDEKIREFCQLADLIDSDGEVLVSWLICAATRRHDGGGVGLAIPHQEAMPRWEARGILQEVLDYVMCEEEEEDGEFES